MGRIKLNDAKKKAISILIDDDVFNGIERLNIKSKSQLINWLLKEHFNFISK
jgi:hypothetical protein